MKLCWPLQMPPTAKSVLISLANFADDDGHCWPSIELLSEQTCASRRSVIDAIKWLEASGVVSADRSNGRHTKYDIFPACFVAPQIKSLRSEKRKTSANSADQPVQIRQEPVQIRQILSAQIEPTSADSAENLTEFALVPVQIRQEPVQMPHTNPQEPPIEPSGTTKGVRKSSKGFDAASIDLPEWLPTEVWAMWVENRIATRKPITKIAAKLQLEGLENLRLIGHDPQKVIENAIAVGWMGLYPGKDGCTLATKATTHDGHGNELPACPVQVIVDLYQEVLPELPPVVLMPQTRTEAIARTWHWVLTSVKTDGTRRAEDASQAEAWFRSYFERARMSDFLMGRGQRSNWQCDLDYLLTDKGMAQVIEKTQERVQESFV